MWEHLDQGRMVTLSKNLEFVLIAGHLSCRLSQLEPELQSAKAELASASRQAKQQMDAAERQLNAQTTSAQETEEQLSSQNTKLQKKLADRDAKIDDWAELLVCVTRYIGPNGADLTHHPCQ